MEQRSRATIHKDRILSTCLLATACQHLWQFGNYGSYVGSHVFTIPLSLASYRMMLAVLVRLRRLVFPFQAEYIVRAASHRTVTSPACAPRLRREKPSVLSGRLLTTPCRTVTYATSCRTAKLSIIVAACKHPQPDLQTSRFPARISCQQRESRTGIICQRTNINCQQPANSQPDPDCLRTTRTPFLTSGLALTGLSWIASRRPTTRSWPRQRRRESGQTQWAAERLANSVGG